MAFQEKIYRRSGKPLILLMLLCFNSSVFSQVQYPVDSLLPAKPQKVDYLPGNKTFSVNSKAFLKLDSIVMAKIEIQEKSPVILDSLKAKASKYIITRKLYDLLIVKNNSFSKKLINQSSEFDYLMYSGRRIRKIVIQPLSVFGSDIKNPFSGNPDKVETLLNKTHFNTNELIIRKNLLFSTGDTVSPLVISDNERILRQLPYIDDSRIIIIPVSDEEVDIMILTKDVYSLGAAFEYITIDHGSLALFEKNILGLGHELRLDMPYNSNLPNSPGFGIRYKIDNISKSFINMDLYFFDGLGKKTYGFSLERKLVSSSTKYAGGISIRQMYTTVDINTLPGPEPLKYNLQDYWLSRSFLIDKESVTRVIFGARYLNNNVFDHPFILYDSYHYLQRYKLYLGSASVSIQKFYKTNLIYSYGRTEDIPYGGLFNVTIGKEINEFKDRYYASARLSLGESAGNFGYFYSTVGFSTFFNSTETQQGMLLLRTNYFSNLVYVGKYRMRNFVKADYTRGFGRNSDEFLKYNLDNGGARFKNDSIGGEQRLSLSLESVLFSPASFYGFRLAFFAFTDLGVLFGTNEFATNGIMLSSIGLGIRLRNDNLVFNTLQIRLGIFPNLPIYSKVNHFSFSGEQLLNPPNFDPGPPSILPYR